MALKLVPNLQEGQTFIFRGGYSEDELKHRIYKSF